MLNGFRAKFRAEVSIIQGFFLLAFGPILAQKYLNNSLFCPILAQILELFKHFCYFSVTKYDFVSLHLEVKSIHETLCYNSLKLQIKLTTTTKKTTRTGF